MCLGTVLGITDNTSISSVWLCSLRSLTPLKVSTTLNKKHLKNVGPIRHCEPPHAAVATPGEWQSKIDVHNNNDNNDNA